ncbi:MAG TPA: hypothetical protein VIL07_11460 [Symbiobacteriaceae bacterium]
MSVRALLADMLATIRAETDAAVRADAKALMEGVARHEELLRALQEAEMDLSPEEVRDLVGQIEREKTKLRSLLQTQLARTDFLLKLILGAGSVQPVGYPGSGWEQPSQACRLNRKA